MLRYVYNKSQVLEVMIALSCYFHCKWFLPSIWFSISPLVFIWFSFYIVLDNSWHSFGTNKKGLEFGTNKKGLELIQFCHVMWGY